MTQPTSQRASGSRLVSIDVLRGLAILAVLCVHMPNDAPGGWRENPWFLASYVMRHGYWGVPLFILLSGFCIHRKAAIHFSREGAWGVSWKQFWLRRFWRLYPPYVAAMLVGVFVPWQFGLLTDSDWLGAWHEEHIVADVVTHLTMTHNLTQEYNTGMRNGVYWSLGLEEQLYALYALLLLALPRFGWRLVVPAVGLLTLLWSFAAPHLDAITLTPGLSVGSFHAWPFMYWLHWVLGALAITVVVGEGRLPGWLRRPSVFLSLLVPAFVLNGNAFDLLDKHWPWIAGYRSIAHSAGMLFVPLAFFSLILCAVDREDSVFMRSAPVKLCASVGRMSYSVYLIHVPVFLVVRQFESLEPVGVSWMIRFLIYLAASLSAGCVFYFLVERRFLKGRFPQLGIMRFSQARVKSIGR